MVFSNPAKKIIFCSVLFYSGHLMRSQNAVADELNSIHGNFQLDGQYYESDSLIGAPKVPEKFLSNVFGNINYSKGKFSAGARYEAYNNVRQGFLPSYKGQGIVNRYARYRTDLLDITIGNFYEQFGNGLMLRAYYEPGLLYDNSIDGARVISNPYKGITLKGVIGKQRYFFSTGPGIVRGVDGEINVNELFDSLLGHKKTRVILGGSFVSKYQASQDNKLVLPQNVGCYGGRVNIIRGGFNFNTEYAYKINDPSADNNKSYKYGDGLFSTISYATNGFSILFQGKRIDNMSYRSDRNESLQNLLINYLPATTKQHSYTLFALNPYATQLKGEIGFMGEMQYKVKKGTLLGGKYGMEITVNYSQANGLKQYGVNDSTTNMTLYKTKWDFSELTSNNKVVNTPSGTIVTNNDNLKYYHDFFVEINKKFNKKFKATFMYGNQFYNRNVIQFNAPNAGYKNLRTDLGLIDLTYKYKSSSSIRLEMQGLFTPDQKVETNSNLVAKGNWATALVEWWPNSNFFMAVYDQYNYGNPNEKLKIHYYLGTMGYNSGPHRITVSYGKQSAGIFCVGGVCRVVPASNGLTLSITSSF
ncbi:MAG TPA: DUF6029 family protein [Bacteroidia bacterium]|jgi:hypothetical protein|nr:DUF6029 family protein [Bacteroidia bacterium]